jgi:hypothetical protein
LPRHLTLAIEHQPHAVYSETIDQWLAHAKERDLVVVSKHDRAEMIRTGEVWFVRWYPETVDSFRTAAAASLERALALANAS